MTLPTFPSGVYWQAVILAALNLSVDPQIGVKTTPVGSLNVAVTPKIQVLPPSLLNLIIDPMIGIGRGGHAALDLAVTPQVRMNPATSLNLSIIPSIGLTPHPINTASVRPTVTPSIGMTGSRQVIFDALGAGSAGSGSSRSWTETIGSSAGSILVMGSVVSTSTPITSISATVGSTPMTALSGSPFLFFSSSGTRYDYIYAFKLSSPPTGSQTITVNFAGGSPFTATANSISYTDTSGFGAPITNSGSGTALSISDSSSIGQRVAVLFSTDATGTGLAIASFNKTSRWSQTYVASSNRPTLLGDAAGPGALNFAGTCATSGAWGAMAIPVLP